MTDLEILATENEQDEQETSARLEVLMLLLLLALVANQTAQAQRIINEVALISGALYARRMVEAARTQAKALLGAATLTAGVATILRRFRPVLEQNIRTRLPLALSGKSEKYAAYYARAISADVVNRGVRKGTTASAVTNGATRKQFVRVRPVEQRRVHSRLEGKIVPIGELWDIAGFLVPEPAHESLPAKERVNCGHANFYLR